MLMTAADPFRSPLTPVASPRPGLSDREWSEWLSLAHALRTGSNVRRRPLKLATIQGVFESYGHVPAPRISRHVGLTQAGDLTARHVLSNHYVRVVDCHGPAEDEHGDLILPHPGATDRDHYRRLELARLALDIRSRYVQGWRPKVSEQSIFGANRFRTFTQEPYFEDRVGFISYGWSNASRWNDYVLNKRSH